MINKLLGPVLTKLPENNKLERIWVLAKTDFIDRYYGSLFGLLWALINPVFQLVVYYFVFTYFFHIRIENYTVYLFSGIIIWMFYSEATSKGLSLLSQKKYIIDNIRIDKIHLFVASIFSVFFGFAFNFFVCIIFGLFFNIHFTVNLLYIPVLLVNIFFLILAIQMILSILFIYFRDINHLWDMVLICFFWTTPVFYGKEIILDKVPALIYLNPLSGIVINFREVFVYGNPPYFNVMIYDLAITVLLIIVSVIFFRRYSLKAAEKL